MEQIVPFDWHRMLVGSEPPLFALEILFRTSVIWLWTLALLRWVGGRTISQLSLIEFLLVIALGSAVGDAMFYPEVPLLHAMLVIAIVIIIDKTVDAAVRRSKRVKRIVDGLPVAVLKDGVLISDGLQARKVGATEVMELLRIRGVENFGSVRAVYMEPSGQISVFPQDPPRTGLPIVPPPEINIESKGSHPLCCGNCGQGHVGDVKGSSDIIDTEDVKCSNCGHKRWVKAEPAPRWSL